MNAIRRLQRGRCGGLCGRPSSRPAVACFAQRGAVFPAADGQLRLFCPTGSRFSCLGWAKTLVLTNGTRVLRVRDTKRAAFGVRQAVLAGLGYQKGGFWDTPGEFCEFGTPKRLFLGYARRFLGHARRVLRTWDTKRAAFGVRQAGSPGFAGSVERRRWEGREKAWVSKEKAGRREPTEPMVSRAPPPE